MGYRQLVHTTAYIITEIAAKVESAFKKTEQSSIFGESAAAVGLNLTGGAVMKLILDASAAVS